MRKLGLAIATCCLLAVAVAAATDSAKQPSQFEVTKWIFGVVGGLIGFIPTAIVSWFKIRSVRAEVLSKRIELIEKVGAAEQRLIAAQIEAREAMKKIGDAWQADDRETLDDAREELSAAICDKVIPNMKATAELTVQRWQENPNRQLQFVNSEVGASVAETKEWVDDLVNHPELLKELGKGPLIIKRSTVIRLHDIALECAKCVRTDAERIMKKYISDLAPDG